MTDITLFNWREKLVTVDYVKPWRPAALSHAQWPPDYRAVFAWRIATLNVLRDRPDLQADAKAYYATRPAEFIMHWVDTYNPRKASMKWMPFVFFEKQTEVIDFFEALVNDQESGLIEKCRDAGATWLACGYSVHRFLFKSNSSIGWGSRKAMLVDELGNPDSIFEKMRLILRRIPPFFLPKGWNESKHTSLMKFVNPENGATIKGEAGDNIGRGGRSEIYFKDESAHYERPEKIEAALGDNTNVQIDISSVNGLGNLFHKRRMGGVVWERGKQVDAGFTRVLIVDWRDHPEKNEEWYKTRRAKYEREGMLHLFAQEVDRDYSASVMNTIIPAEYINAAIDAHLKLAHLGDWEGSAVAGLDVADGGVDRNGLAVRRGVVLRHVAEWADRDVGVMTRNAMIDLFPFGNVSVMYDSIGVGSGVKSEYNRLVETNTPNIERFEFVPWNAGAGVLDPYYNVIPDDPASAMNRDMFANLKAQAWWSLRTRFYKTWRMINDPTVSYAIEELISIDGKIPLLHQVTQEIAQPVKKASTGGLKMVVDKQPDGMKSPNVADAVVMCYFPLENVSTELMGRHGV